MIKQQIVEILKNHSNPWGYQLCGEDSFEEVAEEVMGLFEGDNFRDELRVIFSKNYNPNELFEAIDELKEKVLRQ